MQTTQTGAVYPQADELSSEARPSRAQALRLQALELLRTAEQLDKLRPYSVTHVHKHGESHYLVWARTMPVQTDLNEFIDNFEPQYDEYLSIGTGGGLASCPRATRVSPRMNRAQRQAMSPRTCAPGAAVVRSAVTQTSPVTASRLTWASHGRRSLAAPATRPGVTSIRSPVSSRSTDAGT
jgi:hypothetical protein